MRTKLAVVTFTGKAGNPNVSRELDSLIVLSLGCVIFFHTDPECFLSGSLLMTFMFLLLL